MSELILLLLRLGFLALLWVFVFTIVRAVRRDMFGQRPPKEAAVPVPSGSRDQPRYVPASDPPQAPIPGLEARATRIVFTRGPRAGTEIPLRGDTVTIGRASNSDLIIHDDYTSTHHAKLLLWNGSWMVQDLDSTNGTLIDGQRVTVPVPLSLGASVTIGRTTFELRS